MVSIKEAYEIAKKNLIGMKIIGGLETDSAYYFNAVPESMKRGDGFANSTANIVYKSNGKFIQCSISAPVVMNDIKSSGMKHNLTSSDILGR